MKAAKDKATSFLKQHRMHHSNVDMDKCCGIFLEEMEKGLSGEESSLKMIPTHIETDSDLPQNQPVIVLDAGGTNFRVATVYFDENGEPVITGQQTYPMVGLEKEVDKDEVFQAMAGYIKDVAGKSDKVGFCFSYPMEKLPNKDGRVIHFSKEINLLSKKSDIAYNNSIFSSGFNDLCSGFTGTMMAARM